MLAMQLIINAVLAALGAALNRDLAPIVHLTVVEIAIHSIHARFEDVPNHRLQSCGFFLTDQTVIETASNVAIEV